MGINRTEKIISEIESIEFDFTDKDRIEENNSYNELARLFFLHLPNEFTADELYKFSYEYLAKDFTWIYEIVLAGYTKLKTLTREGLLYTDVEQYVKDLREYCYSYADEQVFDYDENLFGKLKIEKVNYEIGNGISQIMINGKWYSQCSY